MIVLALLVACSFTAAMLVLVMWPIILLFAIAGSARPIASAAGRLQSSIVSSLVTYNRTWGRRGNGNTNKH